MKRKYLFFDIDGTLLSHKTFQVPSSTLSALEKLRAYGHKLFYCTGRSYGMCQELSYLNIHNAIICNGAGLIVNDELIESYPIPYEILKKTCDQIEALGGGYQILDVNWGYQNDVTYALFTERFATREKRDPVQLFREKRMTHVRNYQGTPILKMDFDFDDVKQTQRFLAELDPALSPVMAGSYRLGNAGKYGEIVMKGVTKGMGVKHMLSYFHGSIEDSFGFGDSSNDIEMLQTVHTAVVMGDGFDEAKACASFVTKDIDDDGLFYALKHYHLI